MSSSASFEVSAGIEVEQLAGNTLAVDLISAIGDRLLDPGNLIVVDHRQGLQLVRDFLHVLGGFADLHRLAALRSGSRGLACLVGASGVGTPRGGAAGTAGGGWRAAGIQPVEVDDHGCKPRRYWTLA